MRVRALVAVIAASGLSAAGVVSCGGGGGYGSSMGGTGSGYAMPAVSVTFYF